MKSYILDEDFLEDELDVDEKIELFKERHIQKRLKRRYTLKLALIFLLLTFLFSIASLGLWQLNAGANSQENCERLLLDKQTIGLDVSKYSCQVPELVAGIPDYFAASQNLSRIQSQIARDQANLENQIQELEAEIAVLENQLKLLEADNIPKKSTFDTINLSQKLVSKRTYKQLLEKEFNSLFQGLENLIDLYYRMVNINQEKYQIQEFIDFNSQIQLFNQQEKIQNFSRIKQKYQALRTSIADQIAVGKNPDGTRNFTGPGYKSLFEALAWQETKDYLAEIEITNNTQADKVIIELAEARGYRRQPILKSKEVNSLDQNGILPVAGLAYIQMQKAAEQEGFKITLTSTYRSVDEQRKLFLERLENYFRAETGQQFEAEKLITRKYDHVLERLLRVTAPPGYSRHHNGYTIDIAGTTPVFANSPEFIWISKNNYTNARRFGFIPSYPPNTPNQGPDPEEWEYIYVGIDVL